MGNQRGLLAYSKLLHSLYLWYLSQFTLQLCLSLTKYRLIRLMAFLQSSLSAVMMTSLLFTIWALGVSTWSRHFQPPISPFLSQSSWPRSDWAFTTWPVHVTSTRSWSATKHQFASYCQSFAYSVVQSNVVKSIRSFHLSFDVESSNYSNLPKTILDQSTRHPWTVF